MMDTNTRADELIVAFDLQIFAESDSGGSDGKGSADAEGVKAETATGGAAPSEPSTEKQGGVDIASIKREHGLMSFDDAKNRFAKQLRQSDAYEASANLRKTLAERYGVDPNDAKALEAAVAADASYVEEYARKNGIDNAMAAQHLKARSDSAAYQRELNERANAERDQRIADEEVQVKALYPDFNMAEAMRSEKFKAMMDSGMTMQDAYEALNYKRLTAQAVEKAVRETEDKLSKAPPARTRPVEGASMGGGKSEGTGIDFSRMSDAELDNWLNTYNH